MKVILQLLKKQSEKMKSLDMAIKVIQNGMRHNTPTTVETSVEEAAEVLVSLFNTHECSTPLGDTPKSQAKGEKGAAPSTPQEKTPKGGKGGPSTSLVPGTNGPETLLDIRMH